MDNTITHVAGISIVIGTRTIQRCAICGEKLCDSKNTMMPVEQASKEFPVWEVNRLIRVTEGNPVHLELLPETHKLPDDSCVMLVED